jgi:prepilin-type N-terminal cleavage/methylation domain-containing protein/prepilin-type processing-associated H-X9-DG protein
MHYRRSRNVIDRITRSSGQDRRGNAAPCHSFRRGFTLIELLVVVAIIALLLAILMPALGRARAQARNAVCGSALKEMGNAATIFTAAHKGYIPRGLSRHGNPQLLRNKPNWVRMIAEQFSLKSTSDPNTSFVVNFNRVPVEDFEVFSCPERAKEYGGLFLDYVVNSMDPRGPITASTNECTPNPTGGLWYEVEGVSKVQAWKRPQDVVYIMDAVEESWDVSYPNNTPWGTLRGIRENIDKIRKPNAPTDTGFDWFDVPGAESLPTYEELVDKPGSSPGSGRRPRAALKMHLKRGSNAVFVDGHVEMLKPPPAKNAYAMRVMRYYLYRFGVNRDIVPQITVLGATAQVGGCSAGNIDWQPE